MSSIALEGVVKTYSGGHRGLDALDLSVRDGELLVLVGPSGCGKSTALRIVAGLEAPTAGRVLFDGNDVTRVPTQARDLAMVFQSYALYPHKSVRDNLAFGLKTRGTDKREIARRIEEAAQLLGISELLARRPSQLSGGQRQRVALGRALVRQPRAFLLDEPLSNLDAQTRTQTRAELTRLHRRLSATMVYVTHDQEEAMTLGDRVAVLRDGRLQQVAPPMELWQRPANLFVAGFVGSPAMNLLRGPSAARLGSTGDIVVGVRPTDLQRAHAEAPLRGRIDLIESLGDRALVHIALDPDGTELRWLASPDAETREGATIALDPLPGRVHRFAAASGERLT